jgi:hypothetical protein
VEQWAELRRQHFVGGKSIKRLAREAGLSRKRFGRCCAASSHRSIGGRRPADPQAKGAVERLQGYAETNFESGRAFANELDFQDQPDASFVRINARTQ